MILRIKWSVASVVFARQLHLLVQGEGEKLLTLFQDFAKNLSFHSMVHKVKEAIVHACLRERLTLTWHKIKQKVVRMRRVK